LLDRFILHLQLEFLSLGQVLQILTLPLPFFTLVLQLRDLSLLLNELLLSPLLLSNKLLTSVALTFQLMLRSSLVEFAFLQEVHELIAFFLLLGLNGLQRAEFCAEVKDLLALMVLRGLTLQGLYENRDLFLPFLQAPIFLLDLPL